mmetsp:Transcript_3247/g.9991  ORF Transcript_3247/g.9991 Transcript_3247/m.9991 type:complete len:104 (+) Transcript_3247:575-886(+)
MTALPIGTTTITLVAATPPPPSLPSSLVLYHNIGSRNLNSGGDSVAVAITLVDIASYLHIVAIALGIHMTEAFWRSSKTARIEHRIACLIESRPKLRDCMNFA